MIDAPSQSLKWSQQLYIIYSFTCYPAFCIIIWSSAAGQVSHTFISKYLSMNSCCASDCILLLLLCIRQQQQAQLQQQEKINIQVFGKCYKD